MISSTSLAAFSITPPARIAPQAQVQPVRNQPPDGSPRQAAPALPEARPSLPPPRGTLVNLSV